MIPVFLFYCTNSHGRCRLRVGPMLAAHELVPMNEYNAAAIRQDGATPASGPSVLMTVCGHAKSDQSLSIGFGQPILWAGTQKIK